MYVLSIVRAINNMSDPTMLQIASAIVFMVVVLIVISTSIVPKLRSFTSSKVKRGTVSHKGLSGSYSTHLKPEDVLGNILTKYLTLPKETQVAMCIKHIELWKELFVETEMYFETAALKVDELKIKPNNVSHSIGASISNPSPTNNARPLGGYQSKYNAAPNVAV